MKLFLLVVLAVLGAQALPQAKEKLLTKFENFKLQHNKHYATEQENQLRLKIFLKNLRHVEEHNAQYEKGLVTYTITINKFSDYTEEEMYQLTHALKAPIKSTTHPKYVPKNIKDLPETVDWRDSNALQGVKDQGGCGSCWAFASTAALEAQYSIKLQTSVSLSEQNLVDCVTDNWGCSGGWMDTAFQYVIDNNGIDTEESYPYEGVDGVCRYIEENKGATAVGITDIEVGNEESMKEVVAVEGPVVVAIDASGGFSSYSGGVYYNENCQIDLPEHAVTVIGYGTEDGQEYWLVRNSWGENWGDHGHIKMARNKNNHCGIVSHSSIPLV